MIIHKLIAHHLAHRDDAEFYRLQAEDAIKWIERRGTQLGGLRALDLGAGHGIFGRELIARGCNVTFADESDQLMPELKGLPFESINLDREPLGKLGTFDVVICSNVLEHLARPFEFLASLHEIIAPGGHAYLSWTPWLSPWGGHEFSPFHYLGPRRGPALYDRLLKRTRLHTPYENLFPTYVGQVIRAVRRHPRLRLIAVVPRYYPELAVLARVPVVREFVTWNCAMWIRRE